MANKKMERAMMQDPDRFAIAKNMSVVPGGPMNNNPMNVTNFGNQSGSMSGINQYPYADSGEEFAQMGANILNPMNVPNSGMSPINQRPQPSADMADMMESNRLGGTAVAKGVMADDMGPKGSDIMIPGSFPGAAQNTTGGKFMQPLTSMNAMTPGATPVKTGKKKGKN